MLPPPPPPNEKIPIWHFFNEEHGSNNIIFSYLIYKGI